MSRKRVLVVAVDSVVRSQTCTFLCDSGYAVAEAASCRDARSRALTWRPDAVVLDLSLPNGDGSQLLRHLRANIPGCPVLVLTGADNSREGAQMLEEGTAQLIVKPFDSAVLHGALSGLNGKGALQPFPSPNRLQARQSMNPFIGTSTAIRRLEDITSRILGSDSPILLQGETGTGKGVLANWIHRNGSRAHQPFLDLNCAGLSRELLESELFGHEKGAFTSAVSPKQGLLEVADHGSVFLDEIGDIDLQVQPKLLKVLEDRIFRRVGSVHDRSVDIRLISATHRDLLELVRQQRFRSDLYFRVNIVYLHVPPLRERAEDIPILADTLLCGIAQSCLRKDIAIAPASMMALQRYSWPGNIRELRNVLERAVLMAENDVLRPEHLQFQRAVPQPVRPEAMKGTLKQMESAYIKHVLHDVGGSIERASRRLGIPRSSLYNKMKRFAIPHGTGRP